MIAPYAEIYASFSERCPGIQFEGDWRFLHPDDDCRFADDETGELIEHLQEEFETDQLLASRLVVLRSAASWLQSADDRRGRATVPLTPAR